MKKLYGIATAMLTPFMANGRVDIEALQKLTSFLLRNNVHCLYPCGTTGEMLRLNIDERKLIAETVVNENAQRAIVYIHVGAMTQDHTIDLARHACAIGADGIGVVAPPFFQMTTKELEAYFISVASSVPTLPVYLYNIPQCAANDISADLCSRVANQCDNIIGIKYSYGDMSRTLEYLSVSHGRFSVMHGMDKILASLLVMGCDGTVSGCSNVFPEVYTSIYNAFCESDYDSMMHWQRLAVAIGDTLKNGSNMSYFKAALNMRGLCLGGMRAPSMMIDFDEYMHLENKLRIICEQAKIKFAI